MNTENKKIELTHRPKLKFVQLYEILKKDLLHGKYKLGHKLPTEAELCRHYSLSRPTVAKALDLLREEGMLERKSGVGTTVRTLPRSNTNNFGLLIPGLGETEIFEPICGFISQLADQKNFNLIWTGSIQDDAEMRRQHIKQLAVRYIEQQHINGVFFTPLELISEKDTINIDICRLFDQANIPIVLMDRDTVSFPERSEYDLVGVDNFRLAYILTQHLIEQGCENIKFVARPYSAPTVRMRIMGFMQAKYAAEIPVSSDDIQISDVFDCDFSLRLINDANNTGVLCANDTTASRLMHSLVEQGYRIPNDIKVAGVDDIKYANYLRVPLTTYRQPCKDIAKVAVDLMLSRIHDRHQKARTVYLDGELVVRKSTGG